MITGEFTQIDVPSEINTGEDLIIKVRFSATNPDGSLFRPWKTFLIADIPVMGRYELDAARRYSQDIDTGEKTYNLGPVPPINADEFAVSLFIFGHWDANYDWDWGEYNAWMDGYPVSFTHLDSEYRVLTVTEPPPEEPEILEVDITGGFGHVETSPASLEGKSIWEDNDTGTFPYGTEVEVTAYPDSGYEFEKWTDEIEGGVSTNNPAFVKPMTEHRAVKCHFRVIEEEPVWPLEIDITPSEGGAVMTSPASIEGRTIWHDGNIGTFEEGTIVRVTAVPNDGYQFVKWTDEIQGGVSFSNPASVKPMTEPRTVKCHYRLLEEPPPGDGEPPPDGNGEPPPDGNGEPREGIDWLPVALIGGGVAVALIALSKPGKKKA